MSFVGTTPKGVHSLAKMMKPLIKVLIEEYLRDLRDITDEDGYEDEDEEEECVSFASLLLWDIRGSREKGAEACLLLVRQRWGGNR